MIPIDRSEDPVRELPCYPSKNWTSVWTDERSRKLTSVDEKKIDLLCLHKETEKKVAPSELLNRLCKQGDLIPLDAQVFSALHKESEVLPEKFRLTPEEEVPLVIVFAGELFQGPFLEEQYVFGFYFSKGYWIKEKLILRGLWGRNFVFATIPASQN